MANTGYSYVIRLSKSHLEWGTHRYTGSRDAIYGEGYIPIPAKVARDQDIFNSNGTGDQDILGQNIFKCSSADGYLNGVVMRAQGCTQAGSIYAKQFSANGNLKVLGQWYQHMNCQVGDSVRVTWTAPNQILIEKI